ncbi:MAG: hypothetical protein CBC13_03255 [Planctomycetia bacterium TMED53]|nr:MAG: hypothetical protein CBC13_03255 [Planctomycetia bacterium TMED53]
MTVNRVDLHIDTLSLLAERGGGLAPTRPDFQVDSARCAEGGMSLLCTAIFTEDGKPEPWDHCLKLLDSRDRLHESEGEPFQVVQHPDELSGLPQGVTGMLTTIENGIALEGDVSRLEILHQRGVRILGLVWNGANELGQGCHADTGEGLSELGKLMVREAAQLGWAIDVSHLNPNGVMEVCEMGVTLLATHSNSRFVHEHVRNIDDDLLRAMADCGAVVGVNAFPPFLGGESSIETFIEHVSHIESILGSDRVCLGTDLDGISRTMTGFRDYRDMDLLHQELEESRSGRGVGVLGDNFVRFWSSWAQ